jgi:hypothetical protein
MHTSLAPGRSRKRHWQHCSSPSEHALLVQAGAQAAAQLAAQHAEAAQQSAACDATRAPLPGRVPSPEAAAEVLLAADAMLAANPDMPAARLAHVEVRPAPDQWLPKACPNFCCRWFCGSGC